MSAPYAAVRKGRFKLIEYMENGRAELYDLATDLSEAYDLGDEEPEKREALRSDLHRWQEAVGAQQMSPNPNYDPQYRYMRKTRNGFREMAECGREDGNNGC